MKTIHHVVDIAAPRAQVYPTLTTQAGLASWWSTVVSVSSETVGGVVHFTFEGEFNPDMEITELDNLKTVAWKCVGGHEPWADNTFRFELADNEVGTRLRFWQEYAKELEDDYYGIYNFNWGYYLESLRLSCAEGQGKPFAAKAAQASGGRSR